MNKNELRKLPYNEIRSLYKKFLNNQDISYRTINTAYSDTFYLWRKGNQELFWDTVTSMEFEDVAKIELTKMLAKNSKGDVNTNISGYLSHLRRFRLFLASDVSSSTYESMQRDIKTQQTCL